MIMSDTWTKRLFHSTVAFEHMFTENVENERIDRKKQEMKKQRKACKLRRDRIRQNNERYLNRMNKKVHLQRTEDKRMH